EVYDKKGTFLAASRRYLEVVAWGTRDWLREQAPHPWDLPPELQDAPQRTLWGQPVEGIHCMAKAKHACTASPRGSCIEKAGHTAEGTPHRCSRCGHEWGGKPKPKLPPEPQVEPWPAEVDFHDTGMYPQKLLVTEVTILTDEGKVTVPVAEIQQIDFAPRPEPGSRAPKKKSRKRDVLLTTDAEYTGTIEGEMWKSQYPGYTTNVVFA